MEAFTKAAFGWLLAYLVPGAVGVWGLAYWVPSINSLLKEALKATSPSGTVFVVLVGFLGVGLVINAFNWLIIQFFICEGLYAIGALKIKDVPMHAKDHALALEENFRYCQFYGNIVFALVPCYFAYFKSLPFLGEPWPLLIFIVVEIACLINAMEAYRRYKNTRS